MFPLLKKLIVLIAILVFFTSLGKWLSNYSSMTGSADEMTSAAAKMGISFALVVAFLYRRIRFIFFLHFRPVLSVIPEDQPPPYFRGLRASLDRSPSGKLSSGVKLQETNPPITRE